MDDLWYQVVSRRDQLVDRWGATARDGVGVLGPGTAAGIRMAEAAAYMEFLNAELPTLRDKWHRRREELGASRDAGVITTTSRSSRVTCSPCRRGHHRPGRLEIWS